jgi:regulator of vacuolar morphogenesis
MAPLEITIPRTSTSTTDQPYTIYHINIRTPLRTHNLTKRYSDFVNLHSLLTSSTGAAPPSQLPAKSWFSRTVNNAALTEERRRGLEAYLQSIENARDSRWRDSEAYRKFLELGVGEGKRDSSSLGGYGSILGRERIVTAGAWLDAHSEMKAKLQEARLYLAKREQANTANAQHEAGTNAKKCLVQASGLIGALEDGLRTLSGKANDANKVDEAGWATSDKLGEGELRRRRDLLSTARKEHSGLEAVLNAMAVRNLTSSPTGGQSAASNNLTSAPASTGDKEPLFRGASGPATGRRVLGGPPKETERTRELDNEGVLQLQKQVMAEQDQDVADLTKVVRRMKQMGIDINEELLAQAELLDIMDQDVDRYVFLAFSHIAILHSQVMCTNEEN